ncbi:hypothetical protein MBANPS3_012585 [Mucor bainieri]
MANLNENGINVDEARRTVPARHPPMLSSAEIRIRQQQSRNSSADDQTGNNAATNGVEENDHPIENVSNTSLSDRYLKWQQVSERLLDTYLKSHQLHGHADPCLAAPITIGTKPLGCDCVDRLKSWDINGFMLFKRCIFKVEYCIHQTLLESLLMSQMMPTSTISPKSAVHFSVFESMIDQRLHAYSSISGFVKANNATNLRLSSFDTNVLQMQNEVATF